MRLKIYSGQKGYPGTPGTLGFAGNPGEDAGYCPCPKRQRRTHANKLS